MFKKTGNLFEALFLSSQSVFQHNLSNTEKIFTSSCLGLGSCGFCEPSPLDNHHATRRACSQKPLSKTVMFTKTTIKNHNSNELKTHQKLSLSPKTSENIKKTKSEKKTLKNNFKTNVAKTTMEQRGKSRIE